MHVTPLIAIPIEQRLNQPVFMVAVNSRVIFSSSEEAASASVQTSTTAVWRARVKRST